MKKIILISLISFSFIFSFIPLVTNAATSTISKKVKVVKSAVVSVQMTAEDFKFIPSVINAKVGDTIKITLIGKDNKHSFSLSAFHENVAVNPGQTKTFSFKVNKKGTFTFRCGVPCGSGHEDMTGTLVVS